ncbi:MAG: CopG family transcriptional regulator [Haloferacaceae archaeon]
MPEVEVTVPDRIESDIDRLVEDGEFLNREQAVEELLSMGVSAYDTGDGSTQEPNEDLFTQTVDDQQDPAIEDDRQDDYRF